MNVIYTLIPGMMLFGLLFFGVLIWAVRRGQYEDMEGNASRILMDDDDDEEISQAGVAEDISGKHPEKST